MNPLRSYKIGLLALLIVSMLDLYLWYNGLLLYRLGTLLLIVPILFLLFWNLLKTNLSLSIALFFCWLGDLFLLHDVNHTIQILGVSSYMMAHFFLIESLLKRIKKFSLISFMMGVLFFGAYLMVFFSNILSCLKDMKFIGIAYGLVLGFLGCLSIMNFFIHQSRLQFSLFGGIFLFSVRDVMLTYNKYYFNEDYFILGVDIFYVVGLYLILQYFKTTESEIQHAKEPNFSTLNKSSKSQN